MVIVSDSVWVMWDLNPKTSASIYSYTGVRFTQAHTTYLCIPTKEALIIYFYDYFYSFHSCQ